MTVSYLRLAGGEEVYVAVGGSPGDPVEAVYGRLPDGSAMMEMASAAGLPLSFLLVRDVWTGGVPAGKPLLGWNSGAAGRACPASLSAALLDKGRKTCMHAGSRPFSARLERGRV